MACNITRHATGGGGGIVPRTVTNLVAFWGIGLGKGGGGERIYLFSTVPGHTLNTGFAFSVYFSQDIAGLKAE